MPENEVWRFIRMEAGDKPVRAHTLYGLVMKK